MTNGSDIAAEVAAALGEATAATGDGPLIVTISRKGAQSGPANNPTYGPPVLHSVNALIGKFSTGEITGGLVDATDIKLTVAAGQGVTPTNADTVVIKGNPHAVKNVTPYNPAGETLYFNLQVKS